MVMEHNRRMLTTHIYLATLKGILCLNFDFFFLLLFRLHKTQDLLYASTQDSLGLRYDHRKVEQEMMTDRDRLLRELDQARTQLNTGLPGRPKRNVILDVQDDMMETQARREEEIKVRYFLYESILQSIHVLTFKVLVMAMHWDTVKQDNYSTVGGM